jgi:preprotein translocase subunit SecD
VTLTLAGIAGFILSIGMAVDANVLIFARLKEELRSGRPLAQAVEAGFNQAWPSIRDSNITTMITTVILYFFGRYSGTSIITGFALTLFIGVSVSMFTAIIVTRTLLRLLVSSRQLQEQRLYYAGDQPSAPAPAAD